MSNVEFKVDNLDLSDVSEKDLNPARRLSKEGTYCLKLTGYEFSPVKKDGSRMDILVDSKGKKFHPLGLDFETEVEGQTYTISHRIFVPLNSLWYTKEGGKPSLVFGQQVRSLVSGLTGKNLDTVEGIGEAVKSLVATLDAGGEAYAKVGRKSKEKINRVSDTEFTISLGNGELLENDEGDVVRASSYQEAAEQFEAILNRRYNPGVEIKYFMASAPKDA